MGSCHQKYTAQSVIVARGDLGNCLAWSGDAQDWRGFMTVIQDHFQEIRASTNPRRSVDFLSLQAYKYHFEGYLRYMILQL